MGAGEQRESALQRAGEGEAEAGSTRIAPGKQTRTGMGAELRTAGSSASPEGEAGAKPSAAEGGMRVEDWVMSGPLMAAMGLGDEATEAPRRATLEEAYRKFRTYRSQLKAEAGMRGGRTGAMLLPGIPTASGMIREDLESMLAPLGYASIADFERFVEGFEDSFEREAARSARHLLDRYAAVLHKEAARYRDPAELSSLHGKLGGLRKQHATFEQNAQLANDHAANAERSRMPGNGHLRPAGNPLEAQAAHQRAVTAKASAEREVQRLAAAHPIFQEDGVPEGRRIDKAALADADEGALGGLLQGHISRRLTDVAEAKALLQAKPELVYKLDKLFPQLLAEQSVAPGSVFAMILEDKLRDDAVVRLTAGILVAAVSIALAAVSLGSATPVIAAGAAVLGFGLSAGMAYQEVKEHGEQKDLSDVGFTEDPSVAWLAAAVLGAALDLGAAARAMKALGPAAQAVAHGGDPAELTKLIRAYEKAGELDAKIARSVEKAAEARQGFFEAITELRAALLSKAYAFPGPLADPDVFRLLVRLAKEGMNTAFHEFSGFVSYLRLKFLLSELTSEELVQVRRAWDQEKLLEASAKVPIEIREGDALIGRFSNGSHLEIIPRHREDALYGGNSISLDPARTTTVTGTLGQTNAVGRRGFHTPGVTFMGENIGGLNLLRSPQWKTIQRKHQDLLKSDKMAYWKTVTDEFWETVNKPWLDEAVQRGDAFRFVSDPTSETALHVMEQNRFVLDKGEKIRSIFGREVDYLKSQGYVFHADGTATKGS
jgi:hypothetical protein